MAADVHITRLFYVPEDLRQIVELHSCVLQLLTGGLKQRVELRDQPPVDMAIIDRDEAFLPVIGFESGTY